MRRREFFGVIGGLTLWSLAARAQRPTKMVRIGFLGAVSPEDIGSLLDTFRQGLREFGYIEGQSIEIEYRWAGGKYDRLPELATELTRLGVRYA
jgi:putative ABC transport system substrate-binding protein